MLWVGSPLRCQVWIGIFALKTFLYELLCWEICLVQRVQYDSRLIHCCPKLTILTILPVDFIILYSESNSRFLKVYHFPKGIFLRKIPVFFILPSYTKLNALYKIWVFNYKQTIINIYDHNDNSPKIVFKSFEYFLVLQTYTTREISFVWASKFVVASQS